MGLEVLRTEAQLSAGSLLRQGPAQTVLGMQEMGSSLLGCSF